MRKEISEYISATGNHLKRSREARLVAYLCLFMLFVTIWLPAPVEKRAVPGNSMEFRSSDQHPLNVIALTVRWNKNNAETVKNWWYTRLPYTMVDAFADSGLGAGQGEARWNAVLAIRSLTGWDLEPPVVHIAGRVTGTSSGLGWALATLAQNDPEFLDGLKVAATGTITPTGEIMPVGSISVKTQSRSLSSVDLLLVPLDQYPDAESTLNGRANLPRLKLKGVRNLSEAVRSICIIKPGSPTCSNLHLNRVTLN